MNTQQFLYRHPEAVASEVFEARRIPLRSQRGGFALIVAILLMGLCVLLVTSLSTMVRVETATSAVNRYQQEARANALFALRVGLGQLQQAAGPDQRVTARADIVGQLLSSEAGLAGMSFDTPENPISFMINNTTNPYYDIFLAGVGQDDYQVIIRASNVGPVSGVQTYDLPGAVYPDPKYVFVAGLPFAGGQLPNSVNIAWAGLFNPRAFTPNYAYFDQAYEMGYDKQAVFRGGFLADSEAESYQVQLPGNGIGYVISFEYAGLGFWIRSRNLNGNGITQPVKGANLRSTQ